VHRRLALVTALSVATAACASGTDAPAAGSSPEVVTAPSPSPTVDDEPTETAAPSPSPSPVALEELELRLVEVATGFVGPTLVADAPGGGALLVLEQPGVVRRVVGGEISTWVDLTDRVTSGGERGLLGLAVHPTDPTRVFVHYSGAGGATTVSELSASPEAADPASERVVLTVAQPAGNHNGGSIVFAPDGTLLVALGDGGGAGDPFEQGQDTGSRLGGILRLDVDGAEPYAVPEDNPFRSGDAPELWVYGLRNPYRIAVAGDLLYVPDVGQNAVEEVTVLPLAEAAGANLGWPILEGDACFQRSGCSADGTVLPQVTYTHDDGSCSIIGAGVYTADAMPSLHGHLFYGDLCSGIVRSAAFGPDGALVAERDWTDQIGPLTGVLSFSSALGGRLFATTQDGRVLEVTSAG
jgi:glucose/arabinose dehydrogenase